MASDGSGKKANIKSWKKSKGGNKKASGKSGSDKAKAIADRFPKKSDDPF